jgi:Na+-translocating ferredoxin:NAD+ oxidoreductase RNF subunit RnfB
MLVTAVLVMGALAALLAALLTIAWKWLAVEEDEHLQAVMEALPGNNCGACGRPGCRGFADSLLAGTAEPAECTVSTAADKSRIADLLGIEVGEAERRVARLACAGGTNVARLKANYVGEPSCAAAALVSGGGKGCSWGCLGYGDCVASCDFDAIRLDEHDLPSVDEAACTACGDCLEACPKDLFSLEPAADRLWVACRNRSAGEDLLADCEVACTACAKCAFDAPDLITMAGNLPVMHTTQTADRTAIERCPTGAIVWVDDAGQPHRGREASPIVRQGARRVGAT